jgi:hypothetical protein
MLRAKFLQSTGGCSLVNGGNGQTTRNTGSHLRDNWHELVCALGMYQKFRSESDVFNNACGLLCHSFIFNLCVLAVSARKIIRFAPHINRGAFV